MVVEPHLILSSRLRSIGFDMLKQRGSWQASGVKPTDLGIEFAGMFNHDIEDVSELLEKNSDKSDKEARRILSSTFQDVYIACKETVLDEMRNTLSRVVVLPEEEESDEDLYDICRAYGLLLNVRQNSPLTCEHKITSRQVIEKFNISIDDEKIKKELDSLTEKMYQFSQKMLETVPPLVSETITDTLFQKDWHEKELSPEWNEELKDYRLIYYRPILFFSYEGKVSQRGWVGNTPFKEDPATAGYCRLYKKPCLKIKQVSSTSQQAIPDSHPIAGPVPTTTIHQTDTSGESSHRIGLKIFI